MSNLSFIPSAATFKQTQDLLQPLLSEKNPFETGVNFDQFLKSANQNQFETRQSQDKLEKFQPAEIEARQSELGRYKSASQPRPGKVESKPTQEAVADGEKTGSSQLEASGTEGKEVATEAQSEAIQPDETPVVANQEELLTLLANLAQSEAVIRGATQPKAVQMAELTEVMANSELTEGAVAGVQAVGGLEIPAEFKEIPTGTVVAADNLNLNPESSSEGKAAGLGQLSQALPQVSGTPSQSGGDSLFNQGQEPNAKGLISNPVKVAQNASPEAEAESQALNKLGFEANSMTQKLNAQAQLGEDRALASEQTAVTAEALTHGKTAVKDGKVDLAAIQTHLAVNDAPKAKTETPVLNITPAQPSINGFSQLQASGSTGANPSNREELFSQIVEHAKVMVSSGGSEMEVNLKPEHLGKLQLKVTIENEVVTAKFVAESQQVKEIIESNLGQLKRNLQDNGMQVDAIMVSVGNHQGSGSGFEQATNSQGGSGHFKGQSGTNDEDLDLTPEDSKLLAQTDALIDLIA